LCGTFAVLASLCLALPAPAAEVVPTVTLVEGASTIISGANGYQPAPGVRLGLCDIVRTGPQALVQVEFDDGAKIVVGPDSRFVFGLPSAGEAAAAQHVLVSGWAKITVPKREQAPPHRIDTPHFDLGIDAGVAVMHVAAEGGEFFVEQGQAIVLGSAGRSPAQVTVAAGRTYSRKVDQDRGALADGVSPAFVQGMPRPFRDTLPSLLAQLKSRNVQPRAAPDYNHAETEEWLKSVAQFQSCRGNVTVRSAQEALERNGLSVGPIDGILGPRTRSALRDFQQQQGLARSGQLDPETLRALDIVDRR
jgi:hypothetical protein